MKKIHKMAALMMAAVMIISAFTFNRASALSANEDAIYTVLTNTYGFSTAQASGIMANISAESSFLPASDDGTSYGLMQWTGNRKQGLFDYASANNMDSSTIEAQLAYMYYELQNDEKTAYNQLISCENTADGAYNAGYYFCYHYERPKNKKVRSQSRGTSARDYYFTNYSATSNQNGQIAQANATAATAEHTGSTKKSRKKTKKYRKGFYRLQLDMSVRATPSKNGEIIGTLKKGRTIRVKSVRNKKWGKITYLGKSSYVSLRYAKNL